MKKQMMEINSLNSNTHQSTIFFGATHWKTSSMNWHLTQTNVSCVCNLRQRLFTSSPRLTTKYTDVQLVHAYLLDTLTERCYHQSAGLPREAKGGNTDLQKCEKNEIRVQYRQACKPAAIAVAVKSRYSETRLLRAVKYVAIAYICYADRKTLVTPN